MSDPRDGVQLSLFGDSAAWLPTGKPHPRSQPTPGAEDGGAFWYEACPALFYDRRGAGPLRVALDTAILIDYGTFGGAIWSDQPFAPEIAEGEHRDEVLALAEIMHLWTLRDIRLHVFPRQLDDCKRAMSPSRAALRHRQIEQIGAALYCLGHDTDWVCAAEGEAWPGRPSLTSLPDGVDRELVADTYEAGCHVFLTRDKQLLRKEHIVSPLWVRVLSPSQLLADLDAAGECSREQMGHLLLPDSHKYIHVMGACSSQ